MTTHRPGMRIAIRRAIAPDGTIRVLFQADEWHILLPPHDAIDIAADIDAIARAILTERN